MMLNLVLHNEHSSSLLLPEEVLSRAAMVFLDGKKKEGRRGESTCAGPIDTGVIVPK
jgi:hypothetical protein